MAVNSGPALESMAQQFTGLPMGDLIGAPLMAAAKANNQMAVTQIKFMLDTCFNVKSTGTGDDKKDNYEPIMINMKMTRSAISQSGQDANGTTPDPTITPVPITINLPLLTILPLNALAVDDVKITFEMEVKSSYSQTQSQEQKSSVEAKGSFSAKYDIGIFSAEVSGSVASSSSSSNSNKETYDKSNSATYNVSVHAGQLPLPEGVGVIIKAYTNNIQPIILSGGGAGTGGAGTGGAGTGG